MAATTNHGQVAAVTPGRVRIRLHRSHRHLTERMKQHLTVQSGVQSVESNELTGSVLVRYDHQAVSYSDVLRMCEDVGVVVSSIVEAEGEPLVSEIGETSTSKTIVKAIDDLDRRLSNITARTVDLKLAVPFGLGAWGVRQFLVEGLGEASGYIMLWLAVETFLKLHPRAASTLKERRANAT